VRRQLAIALIQNERRHPQAQRVPRPAPHPDALDGQRRVRTREQRRVLLLLRFGGQRLPPGATATDIRVLPAIGLVAETSCRFLKELSFPDLLHIGLRLDKLGNSSVIYQLAVFRGDDEDAAAVGRFVHVYVDTRTRRPVPVPEIVRSALARL
jgi:Thioesterase-like superfamily